MPKPISLCFIARTAYPLFNPNHNKIKNGTHGGAEVDLYLLATELSKNPKYQVSFIVGDYLQDEIEDWQNIKVLKSFKGNNKITKTFSILKSFKKADADIYIHEAASAVTGLAVIFCKIFGKKFIYRTAHNKDCNGDYEKEQKSFRNSIDSLLYKWGLKRVNKLITQNVDNQRQLLDHYGLNSVVIKNAYPIYPLDNIEIDKKSVGTILWVARGVSWKRPGLFLDLVEKIPEQSFTMICPRANNDDPYDWISLKDRAYEINKKNNNLEFIEHVDFKDIDTYFSQAKLFVNTSEVEGFPNTFIQATKNATPIASLKVNPDDFINTHKIGQSFDDNFDELVQYVKGFTLTKELAGNCLEYTLKEHDISKVIKQYEEIFEQLK